MRDFAAETREGAKAYFDAAQENGQKHFEEMGYRTGICKPKQTEEETVTEIEETQDDVSEAVISADDTVEYVDSKEETATETPEAVSTTTVAAPHTGFAAQASSFAPFILAGVVLVAVTIATIVISKKKK